eukprot:TRINITY_DN9576_c0_g1_i1.p1 TRINITY_DN9576_c0_g1~~TRINITY_DN9576_c0_g1_i1.p1  ORF type:complete len:942 (-),score=219.11 TRINITY_DN9576_c0_g1_i1:22-2847(-)
MEREGWLKKKGDKGLIKLYKQRWFILWQHSLSYFETRTSSILGTIVLDPNTELKKASTSEDPSQLSFVVSNRYRSRKYLMQASNQSDLDDWMRCISAGVQSKLPVDSDFTATLKKVSCVDDTWEHVWELNSHGEFFYSVLQEPAIEKLYHKLTTFFELLVLPVYPTLKPQTTIEQRTKIWSDFFNRLFGIASLSPCQGLLQEFFLNQGKNPSLSYPLPPHLDRGNRSHASIEPDSRPTSAIIDQPRPISTIVATENGAESPSAVIEKGGGGGPRSQSAPPSPSPALSTGSSRSVLVSSMGSSPEAYSPIKKKLDLDIKIKSSETPLRVCLLGDDAGKTALVMRYIKSEFQEDSEPTLEDEHSSTLVIDDITYSVTITDSGASVYSENKTRWITQADGFILVYSLTNHNSILFLQKVFADITNIRKNRCPLILCGTKADLEDKREVQQDKVTQIAQHFRCRHFETSAKEDRNISQLFQTVCEEILRQRLSIISEENLDGLKSGWMKKRKKGNNWKKRFLVLTNNGIRYYERKPANVNDTSAFKGLIPLKGLVLLEADLSAPSSKKNLILAMRTLQGVHYDLKASTLIQRDEWFELITRLLSEIRETEQEQIELLKKNPKESETKDTTDFSNLSKKDIQALAVKKFNQKPKAGIKCLEEAFGGQSPEEIASFLETAEGLSKNKIGEFVGEPENIDILELYLKLTDFTDMTYDVALRHFLAKFRLPGEAQKIGRIIEKFASRFCSCNPGTFETPDTAFILGYSLIMLNTDAHNPSIKKSNRMTQEQFISNNRGIDEGKDLPREMLENLYVSIVTNEIQMDYERDDIMTWELQGHLQVKEVEQKILGKKNWHRKWCIISGQTMFFFNEKTDHSPYLIVPLDSTISAASQSYSHQVPIVLSSSEKYVKAAKEGKELKYEEILLVADDKASKFKWLMALSSRQTVLS